MRRDDRRWPRHSIVAKNLSLAPLFAVSASAGMPLCAVTAQWGARPCPQRALFSLRCQNFPWMSTLSSA